MNKDSESYEGLFGCPASDGNFTSGIGRLSDEALQKFYDALIEREAAEGGQKGRVKAIEKEIKTRAKSSPEGRALDLMNEDIQTAEELYADGMPYELERLENEIRFYQDKAGEALLEMGRRLIRIKAHEGHGKFLETLNRLDMAERAARYAMTAARRFSNRQSIADLGTTKMIALTVLDDDEIDKLENGEAVWGMTLDDIDRMGTRELREKFRAEREKVKKEKEGRKKDRAVQEAVIAQKEQKINELEQQLRYQQPPTKEQAALAELQKLNEPYTFVLARINAGIREAYKTVLEAEKIPGVDVQMLSEWLNQFDIEMRGFDDLQKGWLYEVDNAGPVEAGKVPDDLGGADQFVGTGDVSELG